MAKKVTATLVDDFESSAGREVAADQTVAFSLDGRDYEIDLCGKNAVKLRGDFEKWTQHARVIGRVKGRGSASRAIHARPSDGMTSDQRKEAREWLRGNGWPQLGDRGRIPADAMEALPMELRAISA